LKERDAQAKSEPNVRRFIIFRVLFNARFYYPIFTVLFLDFGLSLEQFAILNVAWAASIVLLEVPSGALADTIGRRNLVVIAAAIMVVEMLLLVFAPIGQSSWIFYLFLGNRILSGAAEAAASGADEALAYDSLKEKGLEESWDAVLETQMRAQSIGFFIAMTIGSIMYDATSLNRAFEFVGLDLAISNNLAMRLPIIGTLILGVFALWTALNLKETANANRPKFSIAESGAILKKSFTKTFQTGGWLLSTPAPFMIILAGFLFDHIGRMILTLNSEYYRQIDLPEASFGIISSGMSLLGFFMPKLGRYLTTHKSRNFNYAVIGVLTFIGLFGMSRFTPIWGIGPVVFVYAAMFLTGFCVSNYLNKETDSERRATALSFKGLSFNLAYGTVGIAYSVLIARLRLSHADESLTESTLDSLLFRESLSYFPGYFLVVFFLVIAIGLLRRKTG